MNAKNNVIGFFKSRKKNIFKTLLFSFSFAFVIPAIISVLIYFFVGNTISKEINNANFYFLKDSINQIDTSISSIEQFAIQIGMSYEIKSFLNSNKNNKTAFDYYTLVNTIKNIRASNSVIENLYIYINSSNTVITPTSHENAQMFFNYTHKVSDQTYLDWINLMNKRHYKEYINYGCVDINNSICMLQTLPIDSPNSQLATLVIVLKSDNLLSNLQKKEWINSLETIVLNQDNKILSSTIDQNNINHDIFEKTTEKSGSFSTKFGKDKLIATYFVSDKSNWKYITLLPQKIYLQKTNFINLFLVISLLFYFMVGAFLIYILTKKNYKPLSNMLNNISNFSEIAFNENKQNEYEFINDVVFKTSQDKKLINYKYNETKPIIVTDYYNSIIKGEFINASKLKEKLEETDLPLNDKNFVLLLFQIEKEGVLDDSKDQLAKFSLSNVCYEIFSKEYSCLILEVATDSLALIVNHNIDDDVQITNELTQLILEIKDFFKKELDVYFSVALSNSYSNVEALGKCYTEALEAMEYKLVFGEDNIIIYSEVSNRKNRISLNSQVENHLINFIKTGDFENSRDILNKIFDENIFKNDISISFVKCFLYDLTSTIMKNIDESNLDYHIAISDILQAPTANEILDKMLILVEKICSEKEEKNSVGFLGKRVKDFVNSNFLDTTLGVNTIADSFNISPPYLSKLFKEQTSISLPEYIQKFRIEKAKELMKSKKYTIKEISQMTGFINSNTFIRAFKKQEGQTPGQMFS